MRIPLNISIFRFHVFTNIGKLDLLRFGLNGNAYLIGTQRDHLEDNTRNLRIPFISFH